MAKVDIIGHTAPDFELTIVGPSESSTYSSSLSALRAGDRAVVIDFFAPWCKACPAAAQRLEELAAGSFGERCCFLLVCVDGGVEGAREFAKVHGISRCVVAAVDDDDIDAYSVSGLPHHVIIAPDGTVAKNYEVSMPADLEAVLPADARVADAMVAAPASGAPLSRISE